MAGRNDWENGWQAANDLHIATSSRLIDCIDSLMKQPTVYLMNIADLRRSSACSRSNCRRFAHITAQREAFLGSSPARASATARAASSGCWLTYGLSAGRCFQRLKIDLLLSLAAPAAAARARHRRLPRPRRAQGRAIRPLCCGIIRSRLLTPCPSVVFAGAQDEGKGEGRRGRHHHRVPRQHPGRRPAPALRPLHSLISII
jgi:hypothetical protein